MNMPEKHFPGKQSGTKSLEIIEMKGIQEDGHRLKL